MTDKMQDAAVRRDWVAVLPTLVKASKASSLHLEDHDKRQFPAGTRLSGVLAGEDEEYWIVQEASSGAEALAAHLEYLFKGHWKLEDVGQAAVSAGQMSGEKAGLLNANVERKVRHRRLYIGFRNRLARL